MRRRVAFRIGVLGARGHVGAELLRLLQRHPQVEIAYLGSRRLAGKSLGGSANALLFEDLPPEAAAARAADAVFLALPNGHAGPYVEALRRARPDPVLIDLSADHRFAADWSYGLPEHKRDRLRGASSIANPGCYATAAQLAIEPLLPLFAAPPVIFGVSGYSGAGSTPSPRNDEALLRDNLMPYALAGHLHEREIAHALGRPVRFMPHVAGFFRGICVTVACELAAPESAESLLLRFRDRYLGEPLISVQAEPPLLKDAVGKPGAAIGGFTCDGPRAVVCATLDNLLKGAASQAVQNLNLALGLPERLGIEA